MPEFLSITVLVENTPVDDLLSEHGLSLFIRHGDQRILLDFGQSDAFARNAESLGIDLAHVDHTVLSHAHYDHADGMEAFFALNDHAPVHLSIACAENCWSTKGGTAYAHYIGIKQGLLERHQERLSPAPTDNVTTIAPGVHLVPHITRGLEEVGRIAGMLLLEGSSWQPDGFAHEMSLVLELGCKPDAPLVILSSCSHAGLPVIAHEVRSAFPNRHIAAYVGGLHLIHSDDESIHATAQAIQDAGIDQLYTGHCTGEHALEMLSEALPGRVKALQPGLSFSF